MILHIGYPKTGSSFIQDEILARAIDAEHVISNESMGFDWIIESKQKTCQIKAYDLSKKYPNARIIIIARHPGEWLESWWRHQTRSLTHLGCMPLHRAIKTDFFAQHIAPHIYPPNVEQEFRKYFKDVRVIPFSLLRDDAPEFVKMFCEYADIKIPQGINYRKVNFSRSHIWCWIQMAINAAWVRWGPRRYDKQYLYIMKHWISRIDGLKRKLHIVMKGEV